MLKDLKIDFYEKLYDAHTCMNCIDLPIAAATGSFNYNNYFYYSFLFSLFSNWSHGKGEDIITYRKKTLEIMGIDQIILKANEIKNEELIKFIHKSINMKFPIILLTHYNSLYFSNIYKNIENPISHGILVSGYDSEKETVIIREPLLVEFFNQEILLSKILSDLGYPFFRYQLKEEQIVEIWKNSKAINSNDLCLISIQKKYNFDIKLVLKKYICCLNRFEDNFNSLIYNYNKMTDDNYYKNIVNRTFKGNIKIIFNCIEQLFQITEEYKKFKKRFIEFRENTIIFLHISALRGTILQKDKLNNLASENNILKEEFFLFLNKLCSIDEIKKV